MSNSSAFFSIGRFVRLGIRVHIDGSMKEFTIQARTKSEFLDKLEASNRNITSVLCFSDRSIMCHGNSSIRVGSQVKNLSIPRVINGSLVKVGEWYVADYFDTNYEYQIELMDQVFDLVLYLNTGFSPRI